MVTATFHHRIPRTPSLVSEVDCKVFVEMCQLFHVASQCLCVSHCYSNLDQVSEKTIQVAERGSIEQHDAGTNDRTPASWVLLESPRAIVYVVLSFDILRELQLEKGCCRAASCLESWWSDVFMLLIPCRCVAESMAGNPFLS